MSRRKINAGSTSVMVPIFVQDVTSTTGVGLGSLVFNTSGLAAKYRRAGDATWTTITLATATVGTFTSGGFIADGGPVTGGYEVGIPNAALAAGAAWCQLAYYGATNMLAVLLEFELDAINYQDGVRGGMIALPNAAANAAGGLPVSAAGALDLDEMNADVEAIQTGVVAIPTNPLLTNDARLNHLDADVSTRASASVAPSWWVAPVDVSANVTAIKAKTDNLPTSPAATGAQMDLVSTPNQAALNAAADSVLRRHQANVEASSYGDSLSLQSLYGYIQMAQESSITGTTLTIKKTDAATTLGTRTVIVTPGANPITGVQ